MKKHLKWIIPTLVLVLLLAAAAVAVFVFDVLGLNTEPAQTIEVYWNVDKEEYWDEANRTSTRMMADGHYRIRMAVGGEQVDYFVENKSMVDQIDSQKFIGLAVDENNVVTQVLKLEEFSLGLAVYLYYVIEIDGENLLCNNMASGRGLPLKLKINDNTQIYDVGNTGPLMGLPCQVSVGSQVYGVMGLDGYVSHLFVAPPFEPKPVYWNVNRQYDTVTKETTREQDEFGTYTYEFVVDGETQILRTRELAIASKIDSFGAKCMHLKFDDEGNIVDALHAKYATGGASIASWYHIMRLDSLDGPADINVTANGFYAEKFTGKDKGQNVECTLADNVKIYDMTGKSGPVGTTTELRLYDQVHCLTNPYGDVCLIFVVSRSLELDLYYNLDRKWDSKAQVSTRTKDADGYYYFEMAVNTEHVTLKTMDENIVHTIDARGGRVLGLELSGDVITAAYAPSTVVGCNVTVFDHCVVTEIGADGTVKATKNGNEFVGVISEETKIYNVSGTATKKGELTTIQVGDKLYGFRDFRGNVTNVFVVGRQVDGPVYWNLDRDYDATKKATKRTPAEDGYYHFKLFDGKKIVEVKTADKTLANLLDSYVAVALKLNGNVIKAVYKYDSVKGCTGGGFASWKVVTAVSGNTVTADTITGTMAQDCVVYDVSQDSAVPVSKTTVQVGDKIHGIKNADGEITMIFVVDRTVNVDLYYNLSPKWDKEKKETTRQPNEEGWYVITMVVDGKHVDLKTKNKDLVNAIDGRSAKVLGLKLKGDEIVAAYKPSSVASSKKTVLDFAVVTNVAADGTITATKNGKTVTGKLTKNCKIYNVSSTAAKKGETTTVRVGDTVYGLGAEAGKLNFVYVTSRKLNVELYYNVERKWENDKSTRVADAEGWYVFTMAVNGQHVQLKTKDADLVAIIDGRAAKVLGLEVEGNVITGVYLPKQITETSVTILDFAVVTDIAADGTITATKKGETVTGKLAEDCKIFHVSGQSALVGEKGTIKVGDTVYGLGKSGAINYAYITSRPVPVQTFTAHCAACDQDVQFTSWDGKASLTSGHWYLAKDITISSAAGIAKDRTVCLNLNGHTINGAEKLNRMFNIYGIFNLMDLAGNGKIIANYNNPEGNAGSVFCVQNSSTNGTGEMHLYSGTLTATGTTSKAGVGDIYGKFYMHGGSIENGAAADGTSLYIERSKAVYVELQGGSITGACTYAKSDFVVGGNVVISNLMLTNNSVMNVNGLVDGASITVTLENTFGTIAQNAAETDAQFFFSKEENQIAFNDGKVLIQAPVVPHDAHCICGGLGELGDHTCLEEMPVWEPWTGTVEDGKYYYLTGNYNVTEIIKIEEGTSVTLCLNGFDMIGAENVTRIFNVYGSLTLCDHALEDGSYAGDVISNYHGTNTQTGRVFYVQNRTDAAFNLYGGNLISNSATAKGGVGGSAKYVNIYSGTICGGIATTSGGNLQIDAGVATIYGGSITGGLSAEGGNIYVSAGQLVINGGSITDGKAETNGADVYGKSNITLGGAPVVGSIYLPAGKTVQVDALTEGALIGVILENTYGTFATGATQEDADRFVVAEDLTVAYADGVLSIPDPNAPVVPEGHTDHCVCGGLGEKADHTCLEEMPVWEAWTGTWESGKYYYLTDHYNVTATIEVEEGTTLNLCLNGFDMIGAEDVNRIFSVFGVLNICDHALEDGSYAGDVINNYTGTDIKKGGVFYVQNRTDAAFNLYGGNLTFTTKLKNGGIGGVTAGFNMYGGKLLGNLVSGDGGALYLEHSKAVANLYGGEISGGRATNGGNIYIKNGTVNIDGATVSGGYASNAGGSIRVQADGNLTLVSGLISGGEAKGNGGNIYSLGNVVITGGTVENGIASQDKIGGNLYASGGSLNIADDAEAEGTPTITGGSAGTGGNIAIKVDGAVISGCTISGGTAATGADIYFEKEDGSLTVNNCGAITVFAKAGNVIGDENVTVTQ